MKIAFIIGCPRSGTSILGELIAQHPHVQYLFEDETWLKDDMEGIDGSNRLTKEMATLKTIKTIRKWYQNRNLHGKIFLHKAPVVALVIPFIKEVFPKAKFIHIVRDGRDVTCSLLPILAEKPFTRGRLIKPPSWEKIAKIENDFLRCAYAWKEIVEIALNDLRYIPHLQIKYEKLIYKTNYIAKKIMQFLELDEDNAVLEFSLKIQDKTENSYEAKLQNGWGKRGFPHKFRIGRWKENLDKNQKKIVNKILGSTLTKLDYE